MLNMLVRNVGFGVLAVAAVAVTLLMAPDVPEEPDTERFDALIEQALDDYEANDARTQGAPQQQVVNGWVARDLLTVIARQNTAQLAVSTPAATHRRVVFLLLVGVLAVCWHALTLPTVRRAAENTGGSGRHAGSSTDPSAGTGSSGAGHGEDVDRDVGTSGADDGRSAVDGDTSASQL